MTDFIFKLRVLLYVLADAYTNWRNDVWLRELDTRWCCDGRECGCGGSTVREIWGGSLGDGHD